MQHPKLTILPHLLAALRRLRGYPPRLCTHKSSHYAPIFIRRYSNPGAQAEERIRDMSWSSTVHTALSTDTEPCIIVTFDNAKYIFNASENTGRMFRQSNRNWRKTKALFFTQATVEKTSGLTGVLIQPFRK